MHPFQFSVIMAVYNVEPFLREAIDSLICQTIGFDQIQLILVDDGSTDGSGRICDEYATQHPRNIRVIHQENSGVSAARNAGLELAEGALLNFLDSDDKLSPDTMRLVWQFFEKCGTSTDLAAIPLHFFDAQRGQHPLNSKFREGTRVIDLKAEWQHAQLSLASAFVRAEAFGRLRFDPNLSYAEDAQLVLKILTRKQTLGVVAEARYRYRKRSTGEASAVQSSGKTMSWYLPYLTHFTEHIIRFCMDTLGHVPLFVQNTLMYDLQWRFRQAHIPQDLLPEEEAEQYRARLFSLLKEIEDPVILAQWSLSVEQKLFLLRQNHPEDAPRAIWHAVEQKWMLCFRDGALYDFERFQTRIHFIRLFPDHVEIEGSNLVLPTPFGVPRVRIQVNGIPHETQSNHYDETIYSVDIPIAARVGFIARIPRCCDHMAFSLMIDYGSFQIAPKKLILGKYCPITYKLSKSYYRQDGFTLYPTRKGFRLDRESRSRAVRCELSLLRELLSKKRGRRVKIVLSRVLTHLLRPLIKTDIWLITDKSDRADDNGEAFFLYSRDHRQEAGCYPVFAVGRSSPDYARMKRYGPVVPYMSWFHKLCHLLAKHTISAYSHDEISQPFGDYSHYYCDLLQGNKIVFLQHGIIKDDLSEGLNRFHKNFSLFVTSARPEYESVLRCNYGYTPSQVILTGLPRYDRLYDNNQKKITVMPTWRRDLFGAYNPANSRWTLLPGFENSAFYRFYTDLLNHPDLHQAAERYGYQLQLLIHPTLLPYVDLFRLDPRVKVLKADAVYRDVFAESALIVTDYSSVAFDFAYLRKPVLYAQFDVNHYDEGYFDYDRDGFGEVERTLEGTVSRMIEYMEAGCRLKDRYRRRIDGFYAFHDKNNCRRVFERILDLDR